MARLDWQGTGQRFYEAGVDRGVLYVGESPGVPWIGLISVNESSSGVDVKPRYLDGVKIGNTHSLEHFEANIEAYTYPTEFEQCDGSAHVAYGLRAKQQRRKNFGLSYRTLVGNDVKGLGFGYKIHLIYNALAEPSDKASRTLNDEGFAHNFDWHITTRAVLVEGFAPSAHFVVDSRDTPADLMQAFEDILYGDSDNDPRLPSPGELVFLFDSHNDLTYDAGDPFDPFYVTYDAGTPATPYTETIDGGTP